MPAPYENSDDLTITELGRTILRYLLNLQVEYGHRNAAFRKVRIDLLRQIDSTKPNAGGFNWGFEAVFTQELHVLEELGLISVKYGSGAIMAGRTRSQIYNLALTDDGLETARIIVDRDAAKKAPAEDALTLVGDEGAHEDSTNGSAVEADTIINQGLIDASDATVPPPPPLAEKPSTAEIAPTGRVEPPRDLGK